MYVDEKRQGEPSVIAPRDEPSLDGFISFLETKWRWQRYRWDDAGNCACAQYADSIGEKGNSWWCEDDTCEDAAWHRLNKLAHAALAPRWRTASFGTLLDLARAERSAQRDAA